MALGQGKSIEERTAGGRDRSSGAFVSQHPRVEGGVVGHHPVVSDKLTKTLQHSWRKIRLPYLIFLDAVDLRGLWIDWYRGKNKFLERFLGFPINHAHRADLQQERCPAHIGGLGVHEHQRLESWSHRRRA